MISIENILNLRGIKTADKHSEKADISKQKTSVSASPTQVNASLQHLKEKIEKTSFTSANSQDDADIKAKTSEDTAKFIQPVAVPCKNYADRPGHFAYIDANTNKAEHVNLVSGKKYTQDEVNTLSLHYATRNMSEAEKKLTWQQVVSKDTLYDQFGSPVFTEAEIKQAVEHPQTNETPAFVTSSGEDAFGLK